MGRNIHKAWKIVILIIFLLSVYFLFLGINAHNTLKLEQERHQIIQHEFNKIDKSIRDSAPAGSGLNIQADIIANYPKKLEDMEWLRLRNFSIGLGFLMVGFISILLQMHKKYHKQ